MHYVEVGQRENVLCRIGTNRGGHKKRLLIHYESKVKKNPPKLNLSVPVFRRSPAQERAEGASGPGRGVETRLSTWDPFCVHIRDEIIFSQLTS